MISQFLNNHNSPKSLKLMSFLTIVSAELVSAVSETVSISISKSQELYSHAVFIHKAVFCHSLGYVGSSGQNQIHAMADSNFVYKYSMWTQFQHINPLMIETERERLKCRHQLHFVTSDCPTRPHCIQSPWKLQIIYLYYIFHSFIWWLLIFNFPLMTLSQLLIIDWHRKMLLLWVINIVLYLFQWYICSLPHSPQFVLCVLYYYMLENWYAPIVHINKLFVSVHCGIIILSDN